MICLCHLLIKNYTQKLYFTVSTISTLFSFNFGVTIYFILRNIINLVLLMLKDSFLLWNHFFRHSKLSSISIPKESFEKLSWFVYNVVSSAYIIMLNCSLKRGRLLMYIKNNNDPNIESRGTPVLIYIWFSTVKNNKLFYF